MKASDNTMYKYMHITYTYIFLHIGQLTLMKVRLLPSAIMLQSNFQVGAARTSKSSTFNSSNKNINTSIVVSEIIVQ